VCQKKKKKKKTTQQPIRVTVLAVLVPHCIVSTFIFLYVSALFCFRVSLCLCVCACVYLSVKIKCIAYLPCFVEETRWSFSILLETVSFCFSASESGCSVNGNTRKKKSDEKRTSVVKGARDLFFFFLRADYEKCSCKLKVTWSSAEAAFIFPYKRTGGIQDM
jgi:hypothetical protein